MHHNTQTQEVTSHGKSSVGLSPSPTSTLPPDCIPLVSIEQLADVLEDGNARKGWMLSKLFYEASGGADHTQTDGFVSRCAPLREYLDLKTGQKAASAMNGGTL